MPYDSERTPLLTPATAGLSSKILSELTSQTRVYPLIHLIRCDIVAHIDAPLTYDQLLAPDSTYTIVRPLTEKYLELENQATVFCLLLNKVEFARDSQQLSISTLSLTRSTLCEILAIRVLRGWSERTLPLANVLLTPWAMFQGATDEVVERAKEEGDEDLLTQGGTALEMAIISGSKRFIRSPSCQKVIEGIWSGRIIYTALNARALIADNYKKKPIQMYNPHKAPMLDHYRLKVPKIRSSIEYTNFLILFILYVVAMEGLEPDRLNIRELVFIIYALAFSLDKLAAIREHGLKVFSSSLVNGFDLVFMIIYGVYLGARTYGFHYNNLDALSLGADWLAIGAVMMFPRLAFVTLANNLMVLSIRSMLTEFFFLMGVGVFCFLGFVYALFTLGQGKFELSQIAWWLLEVYFGLDASGFESAHIVHPFLGPLLIITYALLSNTLLLTVLVAILGNTFATINADAAAESMFRKAVSTLEGVKADAVFSYQLPFNLVAVVFMWPMSYILNPRWFHKLNVFMIRASNFPVLLVIALYERQQYRDTTLAEQLGDFAERYVGSLPRRLKAAAGFENSRRDIGAVFEIEREVGSFYTGWDDDADADIEDEDEPQLPILDLGEPEDKGLSPPTRQTSEGGRSGVTPHSSSMPYTASPSRVESIRSRRSSMPASPSPRISPTGPTSPPRPGQRPRRNSSIHDPSPLARLFISPTPEIPKRLRDRRQSILHSMSMSSTASQPLISAMISPIRKHTRIPSLSSVPAKIKRVAHISKPSVGTIEEGRKVSFKAPSQLEEDEEDQDEQEQAGTSALAKSPPTDVGIHEEVTRVSALSKSPPAMDPIKQETKSFPALSKSPPSLAHIKEESTRTSSFSQSPPTKSHVTETTETSIVIGKASEVAEEVRETMSKEDELRVRLDRIDERQERIEKMLAKLVGGKYADVFSADEG